MSGGNYTVRHVGRTRQPVVIVDDFHPEPERLGDMAGRSRFRSLGPYYPGVQAPADPNHLRPVDPLLREVFADVFGVRSGLSLVQCSFSMVTVPDDELAPIQRLPHVDTVDPGRFALLHYLSGEDTGGTAFYRHRTTGAEILTAETFDAYRAALEGEGEPKPGYMRGSDDRFEEIGRVDARPNRAVLYRSHLLHSGLIPADLPFSSDPATARLTLNSFFQAGAQAS
ncbi:MAG: DUF6445 family protein [Litorimonas sp.]